MIIKHSTESSHISCYPVPPVVNHLISSILHYQGTFVKTEKLALAHLLNRRVCLGFTSFSTDVLFLAQQPTRDTTLHLGQFPFFPGQSLFQHSKAIPFSKFSSGGQTYNKVVHHPQSCSPLPRSFATSPRCSPVMSG